MAKQVQFYSVTAASYAALTSKDAGGIYFVDGGELYKGTSRFGANKVTSGATKPTDAIAGDVNINNNIPEIFTGTSWTKLIGFSAQTYGENGSYIQQVSQNEDGTVYATAVAFPTLATGDAAGQVKLGSVNATVNGWSGLSTDVTNLKSVVSYSGTGAKTVNADTVTATTGNFTNLNVSDTATFSATTVSATTLTVGGTQVNNIAATNKTGGTEGVAVTVSTARGGVTDVGVAITSATLLDTLDLTDFSGKDVVTTLGPSSGTGAATDTQVPTALAVAKKLATLDNAMHFREVVASTGAISDPAKGDIVVIGATPAAGFVQGQEYIYDGTKWELIGDQNTYAVESVVSASVSALQSSITALETSMATRASVGTGTATASYGVSGSVVLAANAEPTFSIAVAPVTTSAGITSDATDSLVTAAAIKAYVDGKIGAIDIPDDTKGDSDKGVQVSVTTTDGVVTSVDVVTTLDTEIGPASGTGAATDSEIPSSLAVRKAIDDAALVWKNANGQVID